MNNIKFKYKEGMVLETFCGDRYLYAYAIDLLENNIFVKLDGSGVCGGLSNVVKIYSDCTCSKVVWEKKEMPKLSEAERVILSNLPRKCKNGYMTRDSKESSTEDLWIYNGYPEKYDDKQWHLPLDRSDIGGAINMSIFTHLFQFVKWEDKEPWSIKELLEASE